MTHYKTLLFDADDTLFDFKVCEYETLKETFKKYGYPFSQEIHGIYERINLGLWEQFGQGLIDINTVIYSRFGLLFKEIGIADDGISFEDDYQELLGMQHALIEGARELIQKLYDKYDLYIVTNGVTATQFRRLKESGLITYFKRVFVSQESGFQKPMKGYFDYCFERIENLDKSKTMIIGDSLSSDIKGGYNAGITTCWFNPRGIKKESDIKADYEIGHLKELYKILGED